MSSSTSSSDPWRRFLRLIAGTAAIATAVVYLFVVLVDPFDTLPLSPPFKRAPLASNQRYTFPSLARSSKFDSAVFGTSTSRLMRPDALNPEFGARFANLAMNAATSWEQLRLMHVFIRAHRSPRVLIVGMDAEWCWTDENYPRVTPRAFPEWMYEDSLWRGYAEMFNMYAIEIAGRQFGVLTGLKRADYGLDGYSEFLPPDNMYDPARAAMHLREAPIVAPQGAREGPPSAWRFPLLDQLREMLTPLPPATLKLLFFPPYNHVLMPPPGDRGDIAWQECKARVVSLAHSVPNTAVIDFMIPNSITQTDQNYWDSLHYRVGVADRLMADFGKALRGEESGDYQVLARPNAVSLAVQRTTTAR